MSATLFARQKITHKWFHICCKKVFYPQTTTRLNLQSAAQYCIFVKDRNSVFKDYRHENISNRSNVYKNSTSIDATEEVADEEKGKDRLTFDGELLNRELFSQKRVERLYPQAKTSLINIYLLVSHELNRTVLTSSYKYIKSKVPLWQATFNIKWPEVMSFNAISRSKTTASKNAALKCLSWLEMNGKLKNGKPIIYSVKEMKESQSKPIELSVTPKILNEMAKLIHTYDTEIQDTTTPPKDVVYSTLRSDSTIIHPTLESTANNCDTQIRNETLKNRLSEKCTEKCNVTLPIHEYKEDILRKLKDNRVLLIEGDTGCGKTTQVPQFIMDSFAKTGNATDCNILVSQPRRISAISLADRIASERDEKVGDVVGYHVRLDQVLPSGLGGILFCTTGILLRKLQNNPGLLGCSHVILDEAHERHVDTDMLMILLKRALKLNPDLRVLIMSATLNANLFQQYFECPSVKVPGRLYSVQMNFMEDIEKLPNFRNYRYNETYHNDKSDKIMVDFAKTVQVIKWICKYKPPGAILCFLPGWNEIMNVQSLLENSKIDKLILPIHSKMAHSAQRKIFEHTSQNTRKIILATDIAETGITVSDVVYVVDSAIRKELRWNENKDLPSVSNCWISQANIQQRKGRAGRVKPGESYHLITRKQYKTLEKHPLPQILCSPLEKVVLDSKTYTDEKAEEFLSKLIEPPSPTAIQKAVSCLIDIDVVDSEENLTALGKRLVLFPTHPKISKALVYSAIFNCVHPVLTIGGIFSGEDNLFFGLLNDKTVIRDNKRLFHPSSDHIALAWIFKQWITYADNTDSILKFCKQMRLRPGRMEVLNMVRNTLVQNLIQCHMMPNNDATNGNDDRIYNFDIPLNKYEEDDELIRALLYSATHQLIENQHLGYKNGILRKMNHLKTHGRARAMVSGESVNYKRKVWSSPFMTYLHSAHCETRRSIVIRETSVISSLSVLLFSRGETQCHELNDGNVQITIRINKRQTLNFSCDKETADVLLKFRDIMWSLVQFSLERQGIAEYSTDHTTKEVFQYKDRFLDVLTQTLYEAAKSIEEADFKNEQNKIC